MCGRASALLQRHAEFRQRPDRDEIEQNCQRAAGQKPTPARNSAGITRNIGSVGSTYQNVDCVVAAMRAVSPVSRHSQMKLSTETSGSDKMSAPSVGARRAVSDAAAMMTPDRPALSTR